ncbi:MAG: EscU/YscU/HrcU family type III secretion system export apparatus switch protein [Rhodospirillaceae bacterium]|nr:EscU/YscU/HrcU family type III secretion system export apparatus switch protein [Rhodospirillaceae bacterium]
MSDNDHKKQASAHKSNLAIALDYSPGKSNAPKVVAKGEGWLAEQIIAIAEANGIEVKEDADLAQLLSSVDVDSEIPLEAFTAVAEILSYVYKLNDNWPDGVTPESQLDNQAGTEKPQK